MESEVGEDLSEHQRSSESPAGEPLPSESEDAEEVSYERVCPVPDSERSHATQTDDVEATDDDDFPEPPCFEPISEVVSNSEARAGSSLALEAPLSPTSEPASQAELSGRDSPATSADSNLQRKQKSDHKQRSGCPLASPDPGERLEGRTPSSTTLAATTAATTTATTATTTTTTTTIRIVRSAPHSEQQQRAEPKEDQEAKHRRPDGDSERRSEADFEHDPEQDPERAGEAGPVVKEPTPLPKPRPPPVPPHPPTISPSSQTKQRRRSEGLLPQLTHVDHLLIKQRLPIAGLRRNSDFNNKYTFRTILGQDVFRAEEATTLCARDCCGPYRAFHMNIVDLHGRPVIALERPPWLNVCCCCPVLPIYQQETRIECPPGVVVGMVRKEQTWFGFSPRFAVNDPDGKTLYGVQGPTCSQITCVLDGDVDFSITDPAGMEIGRVSKEWDNLPKELLATSDNFGVSFPEEIPAAHKALLIGVALILDFIYYEREREKYSRNGLSHQMPSIANSRRSSSQHSETSNEINANFSAWGGRIGARGGTD